MSMENFDTVMSFVIIMLLLSMLITILVQSVVAVLGVRGWNLLFGVNRLLLQIDPSLGAKSKNIAKAILQHPSISHMPIWGERRRKATTIRPQELLSILKDLSRPDALTTPANVETKKAIVALVNNAGVPDAEDLVARIAMVKSELAKLFPAQAQAVQDAVKRGLEKTSQLETQVGNWFNTIMDRTTERFLLYTRWITAVLAFALAFGANIDSIQLFKRLSSNPELRAKLIQSADATLQQAGVVLANQQNPKPIASEAIHAIENVIKDKENKNLITGVPDGMITRKEGHDWLSANLPQANLEEALVAFDKQFETTTVNHLKNLAASYKDVESSLNTAGIKIVFNDAPGTNAGLRFLGELITGLFLSLGAPFWYNALKQLANLRPAIAAKVEKEAAAKAD
jgi:hypothetical protein